MCRSWRWIHGQAGPDGAIPKLPAPPSPWKGSLWTPRCLGRPSSRAQRRETHFPPFIIIPGSKFSSFGIFSPSVVALNVVAHPPLKFRMPPTPCGGTQPGFSRSRVEVEAFPIPLEKDPLLPHPICCTWRSHGSCRDPEGHGEHSRGTAGSPKFCSASQQGQGHSWTPPPAKVANAIRIRAHPISCQGMG